MVALSQLNRQSEGRENKRPVLSDLRDGGQLEQDATLVIFPYREAYQFERRRTEGEALTHMEELRLIDLKHRLEVNIAKNRHGPVGVADLYCDMAANVVLNEAP